MKTALTLTAALVLSLLVLLGIWRLLPSDTGSASTGIPASGSSRIEGEEQTGVAGDAERRASSAADEATREALLEASGAGEESWEKSESVWVRGSVTIARPCAADAALMVYAFRQQVELGDLDRVLSRQKDGVAARASMLLSRRPVGDDGTFELPLSPDTREAHVIVLGRHMYMPRTQPVEVEGGRPVVLTPRCGAEVAGQIELSGARAGGEFEVELTLSGRVEGQVTRELGYVRKTTAAADGSFSIGGVRTGRRFTLDAECERLAPQRLEIAQLAPAETTHARIYLTDGATVRGRVVDEEGRPVEGAAVKAGKRQMLARTLGERETKSGPDGGFTLEALPPGSLTFQANCAGYRESENAQLQLAEGQEHVGLELVLDRGAAISGTLRWWDGTPAARIEISAQQDAGQSMRMGGLASTRGNEGKAETDEQGRFRITGLAESRFDLRASAAPPEAVAAKLFSSTQVEARPAHGGDDDADRPARIFDRDWTARAISVKSGSEDLELVLEPPRGVAGRVADETGAAVTSFQIRAVQLTQTLIGDIARDRLEESYEDEEGRFYLSGMVEGSWHVFAIAEGFRMPEARPLTLPEEEHEELLLSVLRTASVSGTVNTPRGQPVEGATVTIDTGAPFWAGEISGAPAQPSAVSAQDGSFTLSGLVPGSVTLTANAAGHARALSETLELTAGQHVSGIELRLREGGTVTGLVYGADGERSVSRTVQAVLMSDMTVHFTHTDGRGEFRIEHLDAGTWQIQALPGQDMLTELDSSRENAMGDLISEMRTAVVEVEEGGITHVELGRPPADPIEVHGRVTANEAPYKQVIVSFYSEGKEMLQKMRNTTTDADGRYSLTLDGPGKYVAAVQGFGNEFSQQRTVEFQVEIPEGKKHALDLALPAGRISGNLRATGGAAVAGERVTLYPAGPAPSGSLWGGGFSEVSSEDDGSYDLIGLRPGTYSVAVGGMKSGGMFDRSAKHGRIVREVEVREGEWVQGVDFRLESPARARVHVADGAGKPVNGAAVFVRHENGQLVELFSATSTDPQGICDYGGLAPGRYSFSARKDGLASEETRLLNVGAAELAEVKLVLEEGTILWVKLLDGDGNGIQASISVLDRENRQVGTMVALDDIFELLGGAGFSMTERRIGPLPPGEYQVIATTADGRTESRPVNLRKRTERRLSIHFRN